MRNESYQAVDAVHSLAAAAERLATVADASGSIAPEGTAEWLRWLASMMLERAGIAPTQ